MKERVDEILNRQGMRRREKIIMLVGGTYVERISDAPVAVVAEARDVRSISRNGADRQPGIDGAVQVIAADR